MLLAARNGVYGLAMSRIIGGSLAPGSSPPSSTIDESTAMATAQTRPRAPSARRSGSPAASIFVCWNLGTLLGALAGSAIDPQTCGLDAAFPAGFVAMVAPQLRHRLGLLAGLLGAAICLVLIPFTPVGVPILCSLGGDPASASRPATADDRRDLPGTAGVP